MKQIRCLIAPLIAIVIFSSCSIREEIDLSVPGNGHYLINMDMSLALEMMKGMGGGAGQIPDSIANRVIDTTFNLLQQIDSLGTDFTDRERSFFYLGSMNMKMSMKENKFGVEIKYPVADIHQLGQFLTVMAKVDSLNNRRTKEKKGNEEQPNPSDMGLSPDLFSSLSARGIPYIVTDSSIERKEVSKEELKEELGDMKGADMFMNQMSMTTTIKLARPVKRADGKYIKVLEDKKTVVFSVMFSELMNHPENNHFYIVF